MKWKNRLTNYNFWISIVSASLLILQAFDIKLDIAHINEIVTALLGLLVVIGIINDPTKSSIVENKTQKIEQAEVAKTDSNETQSCEAAGQIETEPSSVQGDLAEIGQISHPELENDFDQAENQPALDSTPIEQSDEDDYGIAENDLQAIMTKISQDIAQKYEEIRQLAATVQLSKTSDLENLANVSIASEGALKDEIYSQTEENSCEKSACEPEIVSNDACAQAEPIVPADLPEQIEMPTCLNIVN